MNQRLDLLYRHARALPREPAVLVRVAVHCRTFRTLDAHAEAVAAHLGGSHARARTLIAACVEAGLLVAAARMLPARRMLDLPGAIGLVAVCTRGRTRLAARRVNEVLAAAAERGRRLELAVFDGTPERALRERLRARLAVASRRWGLPVSYCGPEERVAYAAALGAAGAPRFATAWALGVRPVPERDYGANRNLALLHGFGRLLVFLDDDVAWRLGDARRGVQIPLLGAAMNPEESHSFSTTKAALGAVSWRSDDPLALHERWLGAALPGPGHFEPGELSDEDLRALAGVRVRMTLLGLAGDSAIGDPLWYIRNQAKLRRDGAYSRAFLRAVKRPVLAAPATFNAGAGLDARLPLPPFPPALSGEDAVFCSLLRLVLPGPIAAHLPMVLPHSPPEPRSLGARWFATAAPPVNQLTCALLRRVSVSGSSNYARMAHIGAELRRWARARGFEGRLTELIGSWAEERHAWLRASPLLPVPLARAQARALERTARQAAYIVPDGVSFRREIQSGIHRLGGLLRDWPMLCAAAQAQSTIGIRPAKPVL